MCPAFNSTNHTPRRGASLRQVLERRQGLTLIELMIASAIMAMTVAALAVLSRAVQLGGEYCTGHGEAVQHARVVLERITRLVNEATASNEFPGVLVLDRVEGGFDYPDTLVVWHPAVTAVDPKGRPRFDELLVFRPSPERPGELIEVSFPGDSGTVPPFENQAVWASMINTRIASTSAKRIVLTDSLRTASVDGSTNAASQRACVRFHVRYRPSENDFAEYTAGNVEWEDLPWVQNMYGPSGGLRQSLLRIELQLIPDKTATDRPGIAFFDSAAVYYIVEKETP